MTRNDTTKTNQGFRQPRYGGPFPDQDNQGQMENGLEVGQEDRSRKGKKGASAEGNFGGFRHDRTILER